MAAKTWGTNWYSKTHGCSSAWDAMVFDPKLHQLYVGTGGPSPFDPSQRAKDAGDELFTNSVIALDSRTGQYKWHFKEVPHDGWNFEATVGLMIADLPVKSPMRRTLISVPKQGFVYLLDAETGRFLSGGGYARANWAKGLDPNGRPIFNPEAMYWTKPDHSAIVMPGAGSGHSWQALALNPANHLLYIPSIFIPTRYKSDPTQLVGSVILDYFVGNNDPELQPYGELVAWDLTSNSVKWRVRANSPYPLNGGLLHTAGGLVFQGKADGTLNAYADDDGKLLWSHQTGGAIHAAPSTVMVDGQQYLLVPTGNNASGSVMRALAKYGDPASRTPPRLLAFRLDGKAGYPPQATIESVAKPPVPKMDPNLAERGGIIADGYGCTICHGYGLVTPGGTVPDLRRSGAALNFATFRSIVQDGALVGAGMPRFTEMSDDQAKSIYAWIVDLSWALYSKDQNNLRNKE
jgi:quinohemoprotein ethanol dehydrogenase